MELKLLWKEYLSSFATSSNRTFMELKRLSEGQFGGRVVVLIVPLWNWNIDITKRQITSTKGSNRTFMELKHPD